MLVGQVPGMPAETRGYGDRNEGIGNQVEDYWDNYDVIVPADRVGDECPAVLNNDNEDSRYASGYPSNGIVGQSTVVIRMIRIVVICRICKAVDGVVLARFGTLASARESSEYVRASW